jgi:hypothetical protein
VTSFGGTIFASKHYTYWYWISLNKTKQTARLSKWIWYLLICCFYVSCGCFIEFLAKFLTIKTILKCELAYICILSIRFYLTKMYIVFKTQHCEPSIYGNVQYIIRSRDSSVGIATGYGLDDRGVGVPVPEGLRMFSSPRRPDRLWGPPNHLSNGYRGLFLRG